MEQDKIIEYIKNKKLTHKNISFDIIRALARQILGNTNVWDELGRGRDILETQDQLNQYWYSYSPMIKNQWEVVLNDVDFTNKNNIEIVDYACGQGLASILFFEKYKNKINITPNITLIEPSKIALNRAESILQCYLPKAKIKNINKKIDDVTQEDIQVDGNTAKIHLFSNILDIDDFHIVDLLNKIIANKGLHHFLAVSHNRDFNGGSERLKEVYNVFLDKKYSNLFTINQHTITEFNAGDKPAIYFSILLKV